jgi:hypothetical protein
VFWGLLTGVVSAFAQPFGLLVWLLGIGLASYVILHLLFVVHGLLLGHRGLLRALWESFLLTRMQFPSVIGLLILISVIKQGLRFVWTLPSGDSWSLLVGILGNACIATALTAATFVFYQERVGQLPSVRGDLATN